MNTHGRDRQNNACEFVGVHLAPPTRMYATAPGTAALLSSMVAVIGVGTAIAGCGRPAEEQVREPAQVGGSVAPSAPRAWPGVYTLRGTTEGNRQTTGMLNVTPMDRGSPRYDETRQRVRRTYPDYEGPFYAAQLVMVVEGTDTSRAELTCAHGPAETPPLVCDPVTPLVDLERASLVVRPNGRAVLTGSHGEGVSIDYGRFTWTPRQDG